MRPFIIIPFFLLLLSLTVAAQSNPDKLLDDAINRRIMTRDDTVYAFYAVSPDKPLKVDADKTYYWFSKDSIYATQGGYAGRLLNGEYKVFYPDKSLRESGTFRYGLKDGPWKLWYPDGSLKIVVDWKRGIETGREIAQPNMPK